ncbi:unnamed protein product [Arctia plantaginis]|uniref:Uncharacterized protein n=1 Tax=Arctia plantaginis TaxID=874455 RepID=A0A8S0Z242_ARCPL|nr:unnamed protein product [Arctia plantaginis]
MIAVTRGREQAESTSMQLHTLITELLLYRTSLAKRLALGLCPSPCNVNRLLGLPEAETCTTHVILATSGHRVSLELDDLEREYEREEEVPAPLSKEVKPAEQQPCEYQEADPFWDYEDRNEKEKAERESKEKQEGTQEASPERPSTLRVETPAAPPAFADVPAAGLPSGASTPSFGASGGSRRDSQLTDKGYFDVKFYHNRLCSSGLYAPSVASAVGRFAATKPASDIASVIHGDHNSTYNDEFYSGWEHEYEREEPVPAPPNENREYCEEDPTTYWDYEDYLILMKEKERAEKQEGTQAASPERPSTLRVETPAAPPAFADVPAAGLPSGASTPSFGASGGSRRDSQKTEKGYYDVKFYHNRLW